MRSLAQSVEAAARRARESGALVPFQVAGERVDDDVLPWRIEWASSLRDKDQAAVPRPGTKPGAFNPFLPYDPALHVADLGERHVLLLNKFPVLDRHVLIVTRAFAEQQGRLEASDFDALAHAMSDIPGLAFFNGGVTAGASIRHRHLQIAPFASPVTDAVAPGIPRDGAAHTSPDLPFRHAFLRFQENWPEPFAEAGRRLADAYDRCLAHCGIGTTSDGLLMPYNLLATREWLFVVPRRAECWEDGTERVSLNAMSFAGSVFVRDPSLIPRVRAAGLLPLLGSVTHADD